MNHESKMAAWRRLTPGQRDYDRFVARRIPAGASWGPETDAGWRMREEMVDPDNSERGCSCMIVAPCSWCESLTEEETDLYWNGGTEAVRRHRTAQEGII